MKRILACGKRAGVWLGSHTAIGLLCGVTAGAGGIALFWAIHFLQQLRLDHAWILYLLPFLGLLIVALYRGAHLDRDRGIGLVLKAARGEDSVPLRQGLLVFVGTALSHLGGGSTGREGAAVQIGGSIGDRLSRLFRVHGPKQRIMVLSGISAAFSAVFGTPLTAVLFPLEITAAGKLSVAAFWPCAIASLVGAVVRWLTGAPPEVFALSVDTAFSWRLLLQVSAVAAVCALVSRLFCLVMKWGGKGLDALPFMKDPYLRVLLGGAAVVALTAAVGTRDYNGAGMEVIERAVEQGEATWYAFLLKMLFTVLTLKSGYKGGEVVPTLFIGATAGCTVASLIGCPPSLGAAVGMVALFAGVTDCPLSALLLGGELFVGKLSWTLLPTVAVAWFLSGNATLYARPASPLSRYRPK